jgi:divalent metal cation (Fe/Co/Zn/Cd) transporter
LAALRRPTLVVQEIYRVAVASTVAPTSLAIPIMRYLARHKIDFADKLDSRALRADAMESITCGWLSLVAVVSLTAQALFGFWWIDSIGSLAIVWLLIKEGREAWSGECCSDC